MKAKEYFEKYDQDIWTEWHDPEVHLDGPMAADCGAIPAEEWKKITDRWPEWK